jgi:hypothetical protein
MPAPINKTLKGFDFVGGCAGSDAPGRDVSCSFTPLVSGFNLVVTTIFLQNSPYAI